MRPRWEYLAETVSDANSDAEIQAYLNDRGEQGWELFSIRNIIDAGDWSKEVIFKRVADDSSARPRAMGATTG